MAGLSSNGTNWAVVRVLLMLGASVAVLVTSGMWLGTVNERLSNLVQRLDGIESSVRACTERDRENERRLGKLEWHLQALQDTCCPPPPPASRLRPPPPPFPQ